MNILCAIVVASNLSPWFTMDFMSIYKRRITLTFTDICVPFWNYNERMYWDSKSIRNYFAWKTNRKFHVILSKTVFLMFFVQKSSTLNSSLHKILVNINTHKCKTMLMNLQTAEFVINVTICAMNWHGHKANSSKTYQSLRLFHAVKGRLVCF